MADEKIQTEGADSPRLLRSQRMLDSRDATSQTSPALEATAQELKSEPVKKKSPDAEVGGPKGLDPTRFGDWGRNGRCIDF